MTTETALPDASEQLAGASDQPVDAPIVETDVAQPEGADAEAATAEEKKPERHPLEKVLAKEQRRNQSLARRVHQAEAALAQYGALQRPAIGDINQHEGADSEVLSLPKAQLDRLIEERARALAPSITSQAAERELETAAVSALQKTLGDRFMEATNDLAAVFGADKQMAVLRSSAPAALIEYLTDPDNADEAEGIAEMDAFATGGALANIVHKLAASKAGNKPQRSNAAAPIESVKASGAAFEPDESKMTDAQWARHQESKRNRA